MFDGRDYRVAAAGQGQRLVVALGAAAGEDQAVGIAVQHRGDVGPGQPKRPAGFRGRAVQRAGIVPQSAHAVGHGFDDPRVGRRGGRVIQINHKLLIPC